MSRYVLSPAAVSDLEQIWDHTFERWGDAQAETSLREIERAIRRVADNPKIGRTCDDVRPGYRKHAIGSHTLSYRIDEDDAIDVVRVLHRRMDVDSQLD